MSDTKGWVKETRTSTITMDEHPDGLVILSCEEGITARQAEMLAQAAVVGGLEIAYRQGGAKGALEFLDRLGELCGAIFVDLKEGKEFGATVMP